MKLHNLFLGCLLALSLLLTACGPQKGTVEGGFAGAFTDEYGNKFVLNDDYSATIQFVGMEDVENTTWSDGDNHDMSYATISFNGDPAYYYVKGGSLYRHREDMEAGTAAIKIEYE